MRFLMIFTVGLFLFSGSFTVVKSQTEEVKTPFIERTKIFKRAFRSDLKPKEEDEVIIVMRIEGTTPENINSEQEPYVKFDSVMRDCKFSETAEKMSITKKNGEGEKVTIKPWILLVFVVPDTKRKLKLDIDNCEPVHITAPAEVSDTLSRSDIFF